MTDVDPSSTVRVTYDGAQYHIPMYFIEEEHPGGPDIILHCAGGDITEPFNDVGHSNVARRQLQQWKAAADGGPAFVPPSKTKEKNVTAAVDASQRWQRRQTAVAVGTALLVALVVYRLRGVSH